MTRAGQTFAVMITFRRCNKKPLVRRAGLIGQAIKETLYISP